MKNIDFDPPTSVYRLQLSAEMPFSRATELLPYLHEMGIEGVYASPFFQAYSTHGYDITDPNRLNPKLGTEEEFFRFSDRLQELGMGLICDVVPNHMGMRGGENGWWQDVLEKGPHSPFAPFFDIDWHPEKAELENKVLLPILGAPYGTVLDRGEINREGDVLRYADYILPLKAHTHGSLENLLEQQFYRLSYWKVANHEINYRRFFNIHELVAICIEHEPVFEAHHKLLFKLIQEGRIQGLRIDHPDGLYDPHHYFIRLRKKCSCLTVVEKILDREEHLPSSWQVEGTVGYEYLNLLGGLFVRSEQEEAFTRIYEQFIEKSMDFEALLYACKKLFTCVHMVSEIEALGLRLDRLSEHSRYYRDFTRHDLTEALKEVIACFPVYRTYIGPQGEVSGRDQRYIREAVALAKRRGTGLDPSLFDFLEALLLLKLKINLEEAEGYREFILKFQQLTGPIMAKGLEDTSFFVYNRFLPLNEVGGDPLHFGTSVKAFHTFNQEKREKWPLGFLATSTHDTKRSEDVRMRLSALSEMPDRWEAHVKKWSSLNESFWEGEQPDRNVEYMLYQTLVGVWPHLEADGLWEVVLKSIREARQETNWIRPNEVYEEGIYHFLTSILKHKPFLDAFLPFQKEIARLGELNSLSQTALKIASCGIVDIYQGNEAFHFRLIDPDNRRPVEFDRVDPKFHLTQMALKFRRAHKALFLEGEYHPLTVEGAAKEHVIAFERRLGKERLCVVVGRFFVSNPPWEKAHVHLPWSGQEVHDLFADKPLNISSEVTPVASLFHTQPVSYLYDAGS